MKRLIDFEATQPFAVRFFEQALHSNHLVNAYVLCGKDLAGIYRFVLRLAQIINCTNAPQPVTACGQCQACRWIEDNAHPGVITVSNHTFLESVDAETGASKSKTGRAKKTLSTEQLGNLIQELGHHSGGFKRIVVLTAAQETAAQSETPDPFPPPKDWLAKEGMQLQWEPLDKRVFPDAPSNRFLKTLEEPPKDVVFFLLTDAVEKLLETIVSRCQVVPFTTPPDYYKLDLPPQTRQAFDQLLKAIPRGDCMGQTVAFTQLLSETGMTATEGLDAFQLFLWEQAQQAILEPHRFATVKGYLTHLSQARRMIRDKVRDEAVLEDLFLQMAKSR